MLTVDRKEPQRKKMSTPDNANVRTPLPRNVQATDAAEASLRKASLRKRRMLIATQPKTMAPRASVAVVRPDTGIVLPIEYMQQTYEARGKGACFYQRGKYEEAFPYLLAAAKRGFKFAQARVGYLCERGIGVSQDPYAAVGWYAVAAQGRTHPEIRSYFRDVWRCIPEKHLLRFVAVAEEYRTTYGARANRVTCDMDRAMGSYLPKLTCRFMDEVMDETIYNDYTPLVRLIESGGGAVGKQFVPGSMEPLRANRGSC